MSYNLDKTGAEVDRDMKEGLDNQPKVNVVWDDLKAPATVLRQGATTKPDFDATNMGLLFPQNDPAEIAYSILQFPHAYKEGSNIKPHIHFTQSVADEPVFKIDYRWYNVGDDAGGVFTTLTSNGFSQTWTSGDLANIATFPEIEGTSMKLSSIFEVRIYRDDNVVSGDVLVKEFDIHYQIDSNGSRQEFVK